MKRKKIYLYRYVDEFETDLCCISTWKLHLTKSGGMAQPQAPFDRWQTIETCELQAFGVRKPRKRVITEAMVDKSRLAALLAEKYKFDT